VPHVFTLEGLTTTQLAGLSTAPVVTFPPAGSPLAPHAAIVGPTRVATPVFGPGGTPQMYRRRYPARGPVCDYCDPHYFTVMTGGQQVIPPRPQLGDAADFLQRQNPVVAGLIMVGGAIAAGALLSGYGVWLYKKAGERSSGGWGGSDTALNKVEADIQKLKRQMGFDPTSAEIRKMDTLKRKWNREHAKLVAR
jgi:hypothetical protein